MKQERVSLSVDYLCCCSLNIFVSLFIKLLSIPYKYLTKSTREVKKNHYTKINSTFHHNKYIPHQIFTRYKQFERSAAFNPNMRALPSSDMKCMYWCTRSSVQNLRGLKQKLIRFSGRRINSALRTGILQHSSVATTSKLRKIFEIILFSSYVANFWPIQLRGPAENGIQLNGFCVSADRSILNRSGMNSSGFSNNPSNRLILKIGTITFDPVGMTRFLAEIFKANHQLIID